MIFTFYSYKGGVGRSMALANVAVWLFQRGLRVVVVDWDLEAPGIETFFFDAAGAEAARASTGLIDLLTSYKRSFPQIALSLKEVDPSTSSGASDDLERRVRVLESSLPSLQHSVLAVRGEVASADKPCLSLLPAGWRGPDRFKQYAKCVQQFDWEEFYSSFEGDAYFEWLRRELAKLGDIALIDARTGVTEMGGVCTRQLADVVVCLCAPNGQNLDGVAAMAESFKSEKLAVLRGRPLETVMVPSRVDMTSTLKNRFEEGFSERLARYTPDALRVANVAPWELRIPYITEYAYNEQLAVGVEGADRELEESYKRLTAALALVAPSGTPLRIKLQDEVTRHFGKSLPDVFIEHIGRPAQEAASRIRAALRTAEISVWPEPSAGTAVEPARRRWEGARALVLVVSDDVAGAGARVREEWMAARERGLGVYPVRIGDEPFAAFCSRLGLPEWMAEVQWSTPNDVERMASQLRLLPRTVRAPRTLPPLPTPYVERPEEGRALKELLFDARVDSKSGHRNVVGIWGPAGVGKSSLARKACRDPEIGDRFHDGIVWLESIGEGETSRALREVLLAFLGDVAADLREDELRREVELVLRDRSCLIVLDEVDDLAVAHLLSSAAPRGAVLIITRDRGLLYSLGAEELTLGGFRGDEAAEILGPALGEGAAEGVRALAPLIGSAPIALALVSRELQKRSVAGDSPQSALASVAAALQESGSAVIDRAGSSDPETSVAAAVARALHRLTADERERLRELVTFPLPLVLDRIAQRWKIPLGEAEILTRRFRDLALVSLEPSTKTFQVEPLVRLTIARERPRKVEHAEQEPESPPVGATPLVYAAPALMKDQPAPTRPRLMFVLGGGAIVAIATIASLSFGPLRAGDQVDAGPWSTDAIEPPDAEIARPAEAWQRASDAVDAGDQAAAAGDDRKASELYTVAISNLPDASLPYIKRGESYAHQGRFEEAIGDLTSAIRLTPDSASAYFDRGLADTKINDVDAALADFSSAIDFNADLGEAHYQRGLLLQELDQDASARDYYQAAVSLKADSITIDAAISRLAVLSPQSLPWIVVQSPSGADTQIATQIVKGLQQKRFKVIGPEKREEPVRSGGEVRYFFVGDASAAILVKRAVESSAASLGLRLNLQPAQVRDPKWVAKATRGQIEVWFSRLVPSTNK